MNFIEYVLENNLGSIIFDASFKELTTIGTGGNIKYLYNPKSISDLCMAYKYIKENNLKYFILGNGSNVLASDAMFDGIVINMKVLKPFLELYEGHIHVSASYATSKLAYDLSRLKLGDLSFLGGIPGLIGGAIYNNAGSFNKEIKDYIIDVRYIDINGNIKLLTKDELDFGYRYSIFHIIEGIIVSANLKTEKIDTLEILDEQLKIRKNKQPLEFKNMGSIFKNSKDYKAWEIVDRLNLRGYQINGAMISNKHSNFIINYKSATSKDILTLIEHVKNTAKKELGINLDTEITII